MRGDATIRNAAAGSWRVLYSSCSASCGAGAGLRAHAGASDRTRLGRPGRHHRLIGVYGAWKTRGAQDMDTYFRGDYTLRWPHRPQHHGDAGERHHLSVDARSGLRGRHALRPVLLRPAARDDRDQRRLRADLLPPQGLHRVRVPRAPLRRPRALPGRGPLPRAARPGGRHHDLRAGDHLEHDPRLAAQPDQPGDGARGHRLHRVRGTRR